MSHSRRSRYASRSRSPYGYRRSLSRSPSRSHDSSDVENPGNNLYVTGLSSRVTKEDLEEHFASEGGKVTDIHLVVDPWTKGSRGFGFVTMSTVAEADRCVKYLNRSVLEGRVITVEKVCCWLQVFCDSRLAVCCSSSSNFQSLSTTLRFKSNNLKQTSDFTRRARRRRGRTPTPGRYLGARNVSARHRSPSYSPYGRRRYRSRSYPSERDRSYSPYSRRRSYSPYYRRRAYSPYNRRYRSRSRSPSYSHHSRSPIYGRGRRSYSRDSRSYSPERSVSPYHRKRSYSRSISPRARRSRRSYSRSVSPRSRRSRRSYSRSISPRVRKLGSCSPLHISRRSPSRSVSPHPVKRHSRESYAHSRSMSPHSSSQSDSPSMSSRSP